MVWSVFNYYFDDSKVPRKENVALGCSQYKKLLKRLKLLKSCRAQSVYA